MRKEKELLRNYKFRDYLSKLGMNRREFNKLTYATKSKLTIGFFKWLRSQNE